MKFLLLYALVLAVSMNTLKQGYGVTKGSANKTSSVCPMQYWFDSSIDCQLDANTFNRPIAVFSDDHSKYPTKVRFPIRGPPLVKKPPIAMYYVNGNHYQCIDVAHKKMEWPPISNRAETLWKEQGLPNRLKDVWKFLTFKCVVDKDSETPCIDLTGDHDY